MARQGYTIIDVDAHYLEPVQELADYIDELWRTRIKSVSTERLLPVSLGDKMVEGRIRRDVDYGYKIGVMSADEVVQVMQQIDIDASIFVPNHLIHFGHVSIRDLVVALANGYIDYMLDKIVDPARGIYTMPLVPWQDPEEAAAIVDRAGDHPGVVGVCFMSSGANPPLGDVRYDPIYDAAQRHDLPIVYHSAPGISHIEGASPVDGLQRLIEAHSLGFAISNMIQLTSMLLQGVPERFPKLKFVFQESGLFWVPMMMFRLDEYYLKRRSEAPLLKGLPSEYILERCYFGTQPIEAPKKVKYLEYLFEMTNGYEHFLYASDYPHFDYDDPSAILKLPFLDKQGKANVLAQNALRVFNLRKGGIQPWENTSLDTSGTSPKEKVESLS